MRWWRNEGRAAFLDAGTKMLIAGMKEEDVIAVLKNLCRAVCEEYGAECDYDDDQLTGE